MAAGVPVITLYKLHRALTFTQLLYSDRNGKYELYFMYISWEFIAIVSFIFLLNSLRVWLLYYFVLYV